MKSRPAASGRFEAASFRSFPVPMKKKRTIDCVKREKSTVGIATAMWRAAVTDPPSPCERAQPDAADRTSPTSVKIDKSVSANATASHYNPFGLRTVRREAA